MQSCEFITTITTLACAINCCCTKEEVAFLAIALSQLGNTLSTTLAIDELNDIASRETSNKDTDPTSKDNMGNSPTGAATDLLLL